MFFVCKEQRLRSKNYKKYYWCNLEKKQVTWDCYKKCPKMNSRNNTMLKNKSNKLKKIERNRDKNLIKIGVCENCGLYSKRLDPHEVYGGSNRKRSIKYGFVKLICRKCHQNPTEILKLRKKVQQEFEKEHSREEFILLIGKSYLD